MSKYCEQCIFFKTVASRPRPITICTNAPQNEPFNVTAPANTCPHFKPSTNDRVIPSKTEESDACPVRSFMRRRIEKNSSAESGHNNNLSISKQSADPDPSGINNKFKIPLTQNHHTIVSPQDYQRLTQHKWYASESSRTFYACRRHNNQTIYMHREIMQPPKGLIVDHIDGNGLNNTRQNLRLVTHAQNARNKRPPKNASSKYKGVTRTKGKSKPFAAQIYHNKKQHHIGYYNTENEAARAYDRAAKKHFGEFAWLNFPGKTNHGF